MFILIILKSINKIYICCVEQHFPDENMGALFKNKLKFQLIKSALWIKLKCSQFLPCQELLLPKMLNYRAIHEALHLREITPDKPILNILTFTPDFQRCTYVPCMLHGLHQQFCNEQDAGLEVA